MKKIFHCIALGAMLTGCSFLDEYSQDQAYVTEWKDLDELLIGDAYMPVNSTEEYQFYSNPGMFLHLVADELDERNSSNLGESLLFDSKYYTYGAYTWQQRMGIKESYAGDYFTENQTWTDIYRRINICNNILRSSEDLPRTTNDEQRGYYKVVGEAHFLRAFYYLWLANVYGQPYDPETASKEWSVALKLTEVVEDKKFQRNTVAEVYAQVEADLLSAISELNAYGQPKKSIYRADSTAAQLLLARTYLYMQRYAEAERYAKRVVAAHPIIQDLRSNKEAWMTSTNEETIFTMGGDDLPTFVVDQYAAYHVSNSLYESISLNDLRRSNWFYRLGTFNELLKREGRNTYDGPLTKGDPQYNFYYYAQGLQGQQSPVSSLFWLRSSEAYFILAEAQLMQGRDDEARATLNLQRQYRYPLGAAQLQRQNTGQALMDELRQERRIEFAFEGHRWFDLRRYRTMPQYASRISLTHRYSVYESRGSIRIQETRTFTLTEDDPTWTLPLPYEVVSFNTGMPTNNNPWRSYE